MMQLETMVKKAERQKLGDMGYRSQEKCRKLRPQDILIKGHICV